MFQISAKVAIKKLKNSEKLIVKKTIEAGKAKVLTFGPGSPLETKEELWAKYRVFIKYCVFSKDFKIFRTLAVFCFPSVSVCVHTPGR